MFRHHYVVAGDGYDNLTAGDYKSYEAQELEAMGLPSMLLEEHPNPATVAGII